MKRIQMSATNGNKMLTRQKQIQSDNKISCYSVATT